MVLIWLRAEKIFTRHVITRESRGGGGGGRIPRD